MTYHETLHDLHVKYSSTYVGVKLPSGTIIPAHVDSIERDSELDDEGEWEGFDYENIPVDVCSFYVKAFNNPLDFSVSIYLAFQANQLHLEYPESLGCVEIGSSCIYFSRIANVDGNYKYRKMPVKTALREVSPNAIEQSVLGLYTKNNIPEMLYRVWNGLAYRSVNEAVGLLLAGDRLGCALSKEYSIHISMYDEDLKIAKCGKSIGLYNVDTNEVKVYRPELLALKEELAELGLAINEAEFVDEKVRAAEIPMQENDQFTYRYFLIGA